MNDQSTTWDAVRHLLREARNDLAPRDAAPSSASVPVGLLTGTLEEFEEFLDHNELELAWDALASVAQQSNAPLIFWHKLARAAVLMRLPEKESLARQHATPRIPSDRALAIARLDAEKAYRDLLFYRVTVALDADGWHIDYELKDPRLHGGGPHYVIDATTGAILSKRYEQ